MALWLDDKPFGLQLDEGGPSVASCFDSFASITSLPGLNALEFGCTINL